MSLTREEVQRIAHLARLALTDEQITVYQEQLSAVLEYAEVLQELDLDGVTPSVHAVARRNVLREDVIEPSLSIEDTLRNASSQSENQFLIQSVLPE